MSAFHRCDYCGAECAPGADVADHKISVGHRAVNKAWEKSHTTHRTSRIKVLIGIDSINPDGAHFGHDLCDECVIAHLLAVIEELGGDPS